MLLLLFLCEFLDDSSTHLYVYAKNKEKECGKFKNLISLHLINIACVERERNRDKILVITLRRRTLLEVEDRKIRKTI